MNADSLSSSTEILENIKIEGFSLENVKYLLLTHIHADHAGGAAQMKQALGCEVLVSKDSADFLRNGDEDARDDARDGARGQGRGACGRLRRGRRPG